MQRQHKSLDGIWQFLHEPESLLQLEDLQTQTNWRSIQLPAPWQSQFNDLRESTGTGWHRLYFRRPPDWQEGGKTMLHFGAVFWHAQVWLNGVYLGEDEGGYFPFAFEVTDVLHDENELIVRATTPADNPEQYPDYPFSEILHGKQSWYGHWGGIWQSVWLERSASTFIAHLGIVPHVPSQAIDVAIDLHPGGEPQNFRAQALDPDDQVVAEKAGHIQAKSTHVRLTLQDAPLLWSPDRPFLYRIRVELENGDSLEKTCGFRTIEARDGKLLLNGKPFYIRGALDQDYYPGTLSTPPSMAFLEDQMRKAKQMGLNTLRSHIKIADPRYYEAADRLGLLLWVDLPNWTQFTEKVKERVREAFLRLLQREHHRPSIAIWTLVNEDWGTDLVFNADHRYWLNEMFEWATQQDPTRLVVDNSPCTPNFHIQSHIEDYHFYRAFPDHAHEWDDFVIRFANRTYPTYSEEGANTRSQLPPLIVSEFGNWGLPHFTSLQDRENRNPWWFNTGQDWGEGIVHPHGMERRFRQWHMDRIFSSLDSLVEFAQWQQFRALKYEIESMRMQPSIQGYIVTELTDIHWEANGLMDMNRNPRIFAQEFAHLNADILVIPKPRQTAVYAGDSIQFDLWLSCSTEIEEKIREIRWYSDQETGLAGNLQLPTAISPGAIQLDTLTIEAPSVLEPNFLQLTFDVMLDSGEPHSINTVEVLVLPPLEPLSQAVYVTENILAEQLAALGLLVNQRDDRLPWITSTVTDDLRKHTALGGKSLLLANEHSGLPVYQSGVVIQQQFPYLSLSMRDGTIWGGDWVSTFAWLRKSPRLGNLPENLPTHLSGAAIAPRCVLLGGTQDDFYSSVYAGLFVGWLQRPVATLLKRNYGEGTSWVTTLRLLNDVDVTSALQSYLLQSLLFSV